MVAIGQLEDWIEGASTPWDREAFESRADRLLKTVCATCKPRGVRLARVLVDRALGRMDTAKAVKTLSHASLIGKRDILALKALGYCARYSLKLAKPAQHRRFRQRALELAQKLRNVRAQFAILTNWSFAELDDDNPERAERLWEDARGLLDAGALPVRKDEKSREMIARFFSHGAKLKLKRATSTTRAQADDLVAQAEDDYERAIELVKRKDHLRVNLQIERAASLVVAGHAIAAIPIDRIRQHLELASHALHGRVPDDCRAYYEGTRADLHELIAQREYNRDEASAIRELEAAISARRLAIEGFKNTHHHLAKQATHNLERAEQELVTIRRPRGVFLSHAGIDKPRVRQFRDVLETLGLRPWLDENELVAGSALERSLARGMDNSCAAVFFVTPRFKDAKYIKTEIDYALAAMRDREESPHPFSVIAIVLDAGKEEVMVPSVLKPLVRRKATSDLEALRAIVDALPVRVGTVIWRGGSA